ncbi:hypothetical protein [Hymenobacter saemangeumensis]|uniref:hypothetical protein n=1 Tax=Hymenobacter saemangeumensis TaxID=1084522 RepID=UPI0031E8E72D
MPDSMEHSELPLTELLAEEKKIKKNQAFAAGSIGFLVGVIIFGIIKSGFGFITIALPLLLIAGIYKSSQPQKQKLQQIQAAIIAKRQSGAQ